MNNDNYLAAVLKATGVTTYNPVVFPLEEGQDYAPHNDALLARIKNRTTGYEYDTEYVRTVNELSEAVEVVRSQSTSLNELDFNIRGTAEGLRDSAVTKGICTKEEFEFETSGKIAAVMENFAAEGQPFDYTARYIIKLYGDEMSANQKEIDKLIATFKERLSKTDAYRKYVLDNDNDRQIIDKARKERQIMQGEDGQPNEDDDLSYFYAMKDIITSKYTLLANSRGVGNSMYRRALLFAGLYVSILNTEGTRREKKRDEDSRSFRDDIIKYQDRYPTQEEIDGYLSSQSFRVRSIGSLFSLFPYGIMELLYMFKTGMFKEHAPAPVNVAVMFSYPGMEPSQAEKDSLVTALLGREVEFNGGLLVGTNFRIKEEDRYRVNDKQYSLNAEDVLDVKQRVSAVFADEVRKLKFKQNVWRDGRTCGRVAYVTVYKSGIKLWIQDYRMKG